MTIESAEWVMKQEKIESYWGQKQGIIDDLRVFSKSKDWKRDYLKDLFVQLVDKVSFQQIIANYKIPSDMPEWKQRLIEKDNLIEGATFILIPNDESYCKLAWQQKPSREDQVKKII